MSIDTMTTPLFGPRIPRHLPTVLVCLLWLTSAAWAQRPDRDDMGPGLDVPVMYEAIVLPSSSPDSFIVDVSYRLPAAFFVFLRTSGGNAVAQGELLVELAGKNGTQTMRDVRPIRIERDREPEPGDSLDDLQDRVRFTVPPGTYTLVFELKAFDSERRFLERRRTLEIPSATGLAAVPRPLFGYPAPDGLSFVLFNRGGAALFGSRGGMIVHFRASGGQPVVLDWRISDSESGRDGRRVNVRALDTVRLRRTISTADPGPAVRYHFDSSAVGSWYSAYLPLPLERLEPGPYAIEVTITAGEESIRQLYRFAVIWPSRPRSLADFDLAVDALRHIADPEEIDDMIGFFADGGTARFDAFWRKRDPDTATAYNPVQEEYYRRVDEAIRRFSTRGGFNGYKTDRGRVLILFGTPTSSQRLFRPNTGPREIWIYEQQKKRFIFTDPSRTGEYTLTQTEDL